MDDFLKMQRRDVFSFPSQKVMYKNGSAISMQVESLLMPINQFSLPPLKVNEYREGSQFSLFPPLCPSQPGILKLNLSKDRITQIVLAY